MTSTIETPSSRNACETYGLLSIALGITTTFILSTIVRWACKQWDIGARYVVQGFTVYTTYPAATACIVLGVGTTVLGIVLLLVGKAMEIVSFPRTAARALDNC